MKGISILLAVAFICPTAERILASDVQLHLITSDPTQSSGTWTVTADLTDNQSLGIASFSIDVLGSSAPGGSGVTVLPAAIASQTLQVSNPPYSLFRANGTVAAPNLVRINASQDTISAAESHDPSLLRFGDGLPTDAMSSLYGTVIHGGSIELATGRWTASGTGGSMRVSLTPGAFFNLFPLNYGVDDGTGQFHSPPGSAVQSTIAASAVSQTTYIGALVPEPGSIILIALGSAGFVMTTRARRRRGT